MSETPRRPDRFSSLGGVAEWRAGSDDGNSDDDLRRLSDVIRRADPVPDDLMVQVRGSFDLRTHAASDLLGLVHDSWSAPAELRARPHRGARQLAFEGSGISLVATIVPHGRLHRIECRVLPAVPVSVRAVTPADVISTSFESGELRAGDRPVDRELFVEYVPSGPVSLELGLAGGDVPARAHTEWVVI